MNFSAVILAGGKSSRMGCDKAFLEVNGQSLLARQIDAVKAAGAGKVLIAGRAGADYSRFDCRVLEDRFRDAGPLAGIESALGATTSPLLLVRAVDMPRINPVLVQGLVEQCEGETGIVPIFQGAIEPLVAVYPRSALGIATSMLSTPDRSRSARRFAELCGKAGLVRFTNFAAVDAESFANWNTPGELAAVPAAGLLHS